MRKHLIFYSDTEFFKAMAVSLTEFMEMNQVTPLVDLFQVS